MRVAMMLLESFSMKVLELKVPCRCQVGGRWVRRKLYNLIGTPKALSESCLFVDGALYLEGLHTQRRFQVGVELEWPETWRRRHFRVG